MLNMQDKILAALVAKLPKGTEAVQRPQYANDGNIYVQPSGGFTNLLTIGYSFQSTYCNIGVTGPGVDSASIESVKGPDGFEYIVNEDSRGRRKVEWPYLEYVAGDRIQGMVDLIGDLAADSLRGVQRA